MSIKVKVKKLHPDAVIPQYAHGGDAGFDLVAVEDVVITPGETKAIPLGLAFEIPEGYEMQIRPRSGLSLKTKLRQSNCVGTIDSGYRGEVKGMFDNIKPYTTMWNRRYVRTIDGKCISTNEVYPLGTYLIQKGDRIAQGVLNKVPQAGFIEINELNDTERGSDGFGSTGVKKTEMGCPFDEPIYNPDMPKE